MSRMLQGTGGDEVHEQIPRRAVSLFWDCGRAHWGDEVGLGCLVTGFKDGTAVKLKIYEIGDQDTLLKSIDAKVDKGRAKGTYKVDFEDPDTEPHDSYDLYFLVEIAGKDMTRRKDSPILNCDADPPRFSE